MIHSKHEYAKLEVNYQAEEYDEGVQGILCLESVRRSCRIKMYIYIISHRKFITIFMYHVYK